MFSITVQNETFLAINPLMLPLSSWVERIAVPNVFKENC